MPSWTATRARLLRVHRTAMPKSAGDRSASFSTAAICSAENRGGAPDRGRSESTCSMACASAASSAVSSCAAKLCAKSVAQRCRQRRTRCRSTPNVAATCAVGVLSAANNKMRHRSTNPAAAVRDRTIRSKTPRCRGVNTTSGGRGPRIPTPPITTHTSYASAFSLAIEDSPNPREGRPLPTLLPLRGDAYYCRTIHQRPHPRTAKEARGIAPR